MTTRSYYRGYKKVEKSKIKDDSILERIENILQIPFVYGNTKKFLESIYKQYNKNGNITETQMNAVKRVEEKYSKETVEKHEKWKAQYDSEKKEIAKICAFYYKNNPPYFKELAEKILDDLNFTPTEKQFNSMCENKYAQKVVKETKSEPKFTPGQLVQGRKNAPIKIRDCYFSIIEIGAMPVTSSAKGAKIYTLLPLGKTQMVECEERFLKKMRKLG